MDRCESWTIMKAEHQRMDAFELWCWRGLFRVSWTARRSNQSILKEINLDYSLKGLMLKLKFQLLHLYMTTWKNHSFDYTNLWPPDSKCRPIGKDPDAGKDWGQEAEGAREDEMVWWHHWFNGHEFERTQGHSEGQGSLACCSSLGCKELERT